jgi:hypothetical protein
MEEEKGESLLQKEFATFLGYVPKPIVPPRYGGPVKQEDLNCNDILSGKGSKLVHHQGNVNFRKMICQHQEAYMDTTKRLERQHIAAKIVAKVRIMNPPGRFLMKTEETGHWEEIGDEIAREKVRQALRDEKRKRKAVTNKQLSNLAVSETSSQASSSSVAQESSMLSSQRGVPSSDQYPNIIHREQSTLSSINREIPFTPAKASRKRISTDLNILERHNIVLNEENELWSDSMSDDLDLDMHRIQDFISDLPADLIDSPCNNRTFKKQLTPEAFFGSSATTTDYMLAMSRLQCDCDTSESSQMSFGHVALVRSSSFESVPHNYTNLVLRY